MEGLPEPHNFKIATLPVTHSRFHRKRIKNQRTALHTISLTTIRKRTRTPTYLNKSSSNKTGGKSCSLSDACQWTLVFEPKKNRVYNSSAIQSLSRVKLFVTPWQQHARSHCPSPTPRVTQTHVH